MANLRLDKDRMYNDRLVAGLVSFNEKVPRSWDMLQTDCRGLRLDV